MVMRFHWGLGVGHLYSHEDKPSSLPASGTLLRGVEGQPPGSSSGSQSETSFVAAPGHGKSPTGLSASPHLAQNDTFSSLEDREVQDFDGEYPDVVREAEEELNTDLKHMSPEYGDPPGFILDDEEEWEEEFDDSQQDAVYG
jgi:hypothetical protein